MKTCETCKSEKQAKQFRRTAKKCSERTRAGGCVMRKRPKNLNWFRGSCCQSKCPVRKRGT